MSLKNKTNLFILFCLSLLLLTVINSREFIKYDIKIYAENFDIILFKGQSLKSKIVSFSKLTTDSYTHVGILFNEPEGIYLLHSTPDGNGSNGIMYTNLHMFIKDNKIKKFVVLRKKEKTINNLIKLSSLFHFYKNSKKSFDYKFDNHNEEEMYCSELVWVIYQKSGLFDSLIIDNDKPIHPMYFFDKAGLFVVCEYNSK